MCTIALFLCLVATFFYHVAATAHSACNRATLTKVTAKAYIDSRYRADTFTDVDLQALADYDRLDVVKANVSGQLCTRMVVNFPKLAELTLMNANITDIEINAIVEVPKLRMLSLSLNKLTAVRRGQFSNIPRLERLYLTANEIRTVDGNAFNDMSSLEQLHLDRNRIAALDRDWFLNCPRLKLIDLSYNEITHLPADAFQNLLGFGAEPIQYRLEHNQIATVDAYVATRRLPLILHLEGNQLKWIAPDILSNFLNLYAVYLNKNDLQCGTVETLDQMSEQNAETSFYYDDFTCRKYVE